MYSLRSLPARAARTSSSCTNPLRQTTQALRTLSTLPNHTLESSPRRLTHHTRFSYSLQPHISSVYTPRTFATKSSADAILEDIQEQYATARDEFEIATEETEKKSVYAQSDREAAREELDKLKEMFEEALKGSEGEEVKRRVGQRIRELDNAVVVLEEAALHDD